MKRLFALITALVLLAMPVFSMAEGEVQAIIDRGTLNVGVKEAVPGFGLKDPATGEYTGLDIEVAYTIAKALWPDKDDAAIRDAVKFQPVTAKTRGPLVDNGEVDMVVATYTIKAARLLNYEFSKPYYVDGIGLMVKKDAGINSFADLDGMLIGVAQGSTTQDALTLAAQEIGITLDFDPMQDYPLLKQALMGDQIDCFSVDKAILGGYLDDAVVILPDTFDAQPYGVAIKKGNTELLDFVDQVIADARADGTIDEIVTRYPELSTVDWANLDAMADAIWAEYEIRTAGVRGFRQSETITGTEPAA